MSRSIRSPRSASTGRSPSSPAPPPAWATASPASSTPPAPPWCWPPAARERLAALAAELPGAVAVAADVAVPDDRERLVAEAVERCGRVDVLVNNAGIGHKVAVEEEDARHFREVMKVNVTAVWHLSQAGRRRTWSAQRSGSIVNIASMLGFVGVDAR